MSILRYPLTGGPPLRRARVPVNLAPLSAALPSRPRLAEALCARGVSRAQLEASVRAGATTSDRMMIERAPADALDDVLSALSIPRVSVLDEMLAAAAALGLPIIIGWDGSRGCAKLYVNASDTSDAARRQLGARLDAPAAHVYGVNVFADGATEEKRYFQRSDASDLRASDLAAPCAARLLHAAGGLSAGVVASRTKQGDLHAFFVALRPASPSQLDRAFCYLPSFSWRALVAASPFPPASPRSIGISCREPDRWTAYVKPLDAAGPSLHALEPSARFRTGAAELGIYITPSGATARAYARVDGFAVSYRRLGGAPTRPEICSLLDWVVAQVRAQGDDADAFTAPPPPWTRTQRG